jgi:hypothetical protein
MRYVLVCGFALLLFAVPARAENWQDYDEGFAYDGDSATYDSTDDVVVVYFEDWYAEEDGWEAYNCASNSAWWWSEKDKIWKSYTLDRSKENDAPYVWTRDQLCGMKASLPYKDF